MKINLKIVVAILIALITFFALLPTPEKNNLSDKKAQLKISNVQFFDGENVRQNMTIYINQGKITAIQSAEVSADKSAPKWIASESIDGTGKTLLPGLVDAHVHAWGDALKQGLAFGVTTQMDMFTNPQFAKQQGHGAAGKSAEQSDLYSAGNLITAPGGHGTEYGMVIPTIEKADDADAFVKARIDEGSDYIKIVYESPDAAFKMFPSIDKETLTAVIKATHKYGKLALVHSQNQISALEAIKAGADGIVHVFMDSMATDELLEAAKKQGTFFIPTVAVYASLAPKVDKEAMVDGLINEAKISHPITPAIKAALQGSFPTNLQMQKLWPNILKNVERLNLAGIPLLAGTDAPNPGTAYGISLHAELQWLVQAGLSPLQALQAATAKVGQAFKISGLGLLKVDSIADMLLVDGNPLEDIKQTINIERIWREGRLINFESDSENLSTEHYKGIKVDFNQGHLLTDNGNSFMPTTDEMMGGKSTVALAWKAASSETDLKEGYLSITGEIKAGFPFPWSGSTMLLGKTMAGFSDISQIKSITFKARGSAPNYRLMLFTEGQMQPLSIDFTVTENWQTITIPLEAFAKANIQQAKFLVWSASLDHGEFSLDIDDLVIQ